ncbi:ATP-grasp domain-containing protein [Streptomyces hydrogenans]|uniref:Argininosuccinate lyase n=1 Tax=Streptomyces hydrogenans TaxID=1873719 RepID=A0ABQ3PFH8_9ACTN|nr:ATP-grasp domain-containing protein [Streptomyces hydrogenans]GHG17370.1 argininosuccinate lyase [Streptomyces hydrogenans]GHI23775.1 argininosuccinate lyase [Streptomyces hydrogenans]
MLIVVQPLSAGVRLTARMVAAGVPCLVPTQFPELLPPEVRAGATVVDWHPDAGVAGLLRLVEKAVAETGTAPSGVIAGFEYAVPEAAELARTLGLPALDAPAAEAVRQKDVMRRRCEERGVAHPRSIAVGPDEAGPCPLPFPVVVKPVDCGGSLMVSLCRDEEEYARARAVVHDPGEEVKFHPNPRRTAVVEEYVEGPEFSLDGWVDADGPHLASVTSKFLSAPPDFFEMGHIATAPECSPHGEVLERFARQVVAAFDLTVGPFHIETRIVRGRGPVLIEVGARLAGDNIPELVLAGPGVDLCAATADAARGLSHDPGALSPVSAGLAFVTTDRSGTFTGTLHGIDAFTEAAEFRGLLPEEEPGAVLDPGDIFRNRVARIHFEGDLDRVERLVASVLAEVRVGVEDAGHQDKKGAPA